MRKFASCAWPGLVYSKSFENAFEFQKWIGLFFADYGLPDISEIYQNMPESLERLARKIEKAIRKYEPRLKNVRVRLINKEEEDRFRATYLVESEINPEGQITFQTRLNANGEIEIIEGI